jgi:glycosyltransferase involved in cell wall biosynthesis
MAERFLTITLAEEGYSYLFNRVHPVFPNYPDTSRYPSPDSTPRREVVHVGDVTMVRGLDVAVEAAGRAGIPLRLIGPVAEDVRAQLTRRAKRGAIEVIFEGSKPNPEAMAIAAGSAVAIVPWKDLPNYRESAPTKLFEYLALGLPVVASDLPGVRRAGVEDLAVVLVTPGDPEALAVGIRSALDGGLGPKARRDVEAVRARYKWPDAQVRDFYRVLAGRGETQRPNSSASLPGPEA